MLKRLSDFTVKRRYVIAVILLAITALCVFLATKVEINTDMTRYLSADSEMMQGLEIIESEFPESPDIGGIRVMFDGLTESQKTEVLSVLKDIKYVSDVKYDPISADYNVGEHTLYVLDFDYAYGSEQEEAIFASLDTEFASYDMIYADNDATDVDVPFWLLAAAIGILAVIIVVMSESWLEPVLLLSVTGIAVAINLGTNIIFGYTSDLTASIGPVLQLVLSMDYSIILMERFRRERKSKSDGRLAMSAALRESYPVIASSALTTVVGLAVLSLLSFKIGAEIGMVLAKGVLISMVCVLTLLPTLILICEKAIEKTHKKTPLPHMNFAGGYGVGTRYVVPVVFVLLFAGSAVLQSLTGITFTVGAEDPLADVFPKDNVVVLVYENDDEKGIQTVVDALEGENGVRSVTGYHNTVGKRFTAAEMAALIAGAGGVEVSPEAVSVVYYALSGAELPELTMSEYMDFLAGTAFEDDFFAGYTDEKTAGLAELLGRFSDAEALTSPMNAHGLAKLTGLDEETVKLVLAYYLASDSDYSPAGITVAEFASSAAEFAGNPLLSGYFTDDSLSAISSLAVFADKDAVQKQLSPADIASVLGIDEDMVSRVFMLKYGYDTDGKTMSLYEFVGTVLSDPTVSSSLGTDTVASLRTAYSVMQAAVSGTVIGAQEITALTGVDTAAARLLLTFAAVERGDCPELSPQEFIGFLAGLISEDGADALPVDAGTAENVRIANAVIGAVVSGERYSYAEADALLGVSFSEPVYLYYAALNNADGSQTMTAHDFISYVLENRSDPLFGGSVDEDTASALSEALTALEQAASQLKGETMSRLIITTSFPEESEKTAEFMDKLEALTKANLLGRTYTVGTSAMVRELGGSFSGEYLIITLLTAAVIFIIVALTFRSLAVPVLLVLLVQCSVFITVSAIGLMGNTVYYLALLIVQAILMGATIDYSITITSYYRESRAERGVRESIASAYGASAHTVLTSGSVLIIVTAVLGFFSDQVTSEVLTTISVGALCSVLLIILVLPALLALCDRFIAGRKAGADEQSG